METVELTAKTLEDARLPAAEKLGVSPDQVSLTVIEELKGLFGKSQVRVRAEALAPKPAKAEKPAKEEKPEKPAKAEKGGRGKKEAVVEPVAEAEPEPEPEAAPEPKKGRGRKSAEPVAAEKPAKEDEEEGRESGENLATAEDGENLAALLRDVIAASGLDAETQVAGLHGRYVNLCLDGKDAAFLVGKHGEVLNSLQYLLNLMANRKFDNGIRIALDANDYRKRREEQLTALATKIAEQVKDRGEEAVLDALPAFERRIVHKALSEIDGISTYSEGEEPNRRVVIAPAD